MVITPAIKLGINYIECMVFNFTFMMMAGRPGEGRVPVVVRNGVKLNLLIVQIILQGSKS